MRCSVKCTISVSEPRKTCEAKLTRCLSAVAELLVKFAMKLTMKTILTVFRGCPPVKNACRSMSHCTMQECACDRYTV